MAYWKLKTNQSSSYLASKELMENLKGIVTGTITTVAGLDTTYLVAGDCYTIGTGPTSGMYYSLADPAGSTTITTWSMRKYHYAKGQSSGYGANRKLFFKFDDTYGFRMHSSEPSENNHFPHSGNGTTTTNGSTSDGNYNDSHGVSSLTEMHIIINDTTFLVWCTSSQQSTGDVYWFMLQDLEYMPTVDPYYETADSDYAPIVAGMAFMKDVIFNDNNTNTTSTDNGNMWAMSSWKDTGGTARNSSYSFSSFTHRTAGTGAGLNMYIIPPMSVEFRSMDDASGTVYPLIPMTFAGNQHQTNEQQNTRAWSKAMNVYRTSDDIASFDRIQVGSTYYKVFRMMPSGNHNATGTGSVHKACMAFPENNVPF